MMRRVVGLVAVAISTLLLSTLLVSFATAETAELEGTSISTVLDGQEALVTLPAGDGTPKGLVLFFHGQGGTASNKIEEPWLASLSRDGWAIASGDLHITSWGNEASTRDVRNLIDWAEAETGLETKIWVSGSMGGAVSLNAMNFGIEAPACWYGVKPAISLTQMDKVPGGPGYIKSAYAGRVPADRDPVRNLDSLSIATRYRVVASPDDHWVIYDQNAGPLVETLTSKGASVSLFEAEGLHMDPSHFNNYDVVEFANTCVGDDVGSASAATS